MSPAEETESIAMSREAIALGVTVLNTGNFCGMGHNELLIRRAIEVQRDRDLVSIKVGALCIPDGQFNGFDTRPLAVAPGWGRLWALSTST